MEKIEGVYKDAVELMPFNQEESFNILVLGSSSEIMLAHLIERYPRANFTLADSSEEKIKTTMTLLGEISAKHNFFCCNFIRYNFPNAPTQQGYDIVISALALYQCTSAELNAVFTKIYNALKPNSIFINIDYIRDKISETQSTDREGPAETNNLSANNFQSVSLLKTPPKHSLESHINLLQAKGFIGTTVDHQEAGLVSYSAQKPLKELFRL